MILWHAAVLAAVFFGAATQRVTGLGLALVAGPFLVLASGPVQGVLIGNLLSLGVSSTVAATTWRHVEWRTTLVLILSAVVTIPVGVLVLHTVPSAGLMVGMGVLVLGSLVVTSRVTGVGVHRASHAVAAGATGGFMNVVAGLGGPAMVVYGRVRCWGHVAFVASVQWYFMAVNTTSLIWKGLPAIDGVDLVVLCGGVLAGLLVGGWLRRHVDATTASRWAVLLAASGAVAVSLRGVWLLAT